MSSNSSKSSGEYSLNQNQQENLPTHWKWNQLLREDEMTQNGVYQHPWLVQNINSHALVCC
jgi:hypothetical protein